MIVQGPPGCAPGQASGLPTEPIPPASVTPFNGGLRPVGRGLGWLLNYLAPGVRFECREEGYAVSLSWTGIVIGFGNLLAISLIVSMYGLFVVSLLRFEYYGPITNIEETAYSWNIGRNFARYGFMQTLFLQDVGHSPYAADHPYTYNHQPPGADVITGAFMSIFPENFRLLRIFFSVIFLVGLMTFFAFANVILRQFTLPLASYTAIFLSGWIMFQGFDKQTSYHHPLLLFGPLLLYHYWSVSRNRIYLVLALLLTLAASFILDYVVLAAVLWGWAFLYLTKILPVSFRQASLFGAVIVLGIVLHLLQNMLYLGWDLFIRELAMTIGNRTIGVPSQATMTEFYREISLVHHGSRPPQPGVLVQQLIRQFSFELSLPPGAAWYALWVALLMLGLSIVPRLKLVREPITIMLLRGQWLDDIGCIVRLWVWIFGTITIPNVMFPAFNQEVVLAGSGVTLWYLSIGTVALVACGVHCAGDVCLRSWRFLVASRQVAHPRPRPIITSALSSPKNGASASLPGSAPDVASARLDRPELTSDTPHRLQWRHVVKPAIALLFIGLAGLILTLVAGIRINEIPRPLRIAIYIIGLSTVVLLLAQAASWLVQTPGFGPAIAWAWRKAYTVARTALVPVNAPRMRRIGRSSGRWAWTALTIVIAPLISFVLLAFCGMLMYEAGSARLSEYRTLRGIVSELKYARLSDLRAFQGELFMTNINTPIIGFFTESPGFGVCGLDSVPSLADFDTSACKVAFMRRHEYWDNQLPRYFFFFRAPELFPGFADCIPVSTLQSVTRESNCVEQLRQRLAERASLVFDNGIFEVFEIHARS